MTVPRRMVRTMSKPSDIVNIALAELGYKEKASNASLDDKTANAGSNNWTKYARDLAAAGYYNGNKNGFAWCDVFVDWCFFKAYGAVEASVSSASPVRSVPAVSTRHNTTSRKADTTGRPRLVTRFSSKPAARSAIPASLSK